jgi:hypothetical protein
MRLHLPFQHGDLLAEGGDHRGQGPRHGGSSSGDRGGLGQLRAAQRGPDRGGLAVMSRRRARSSAAEIRAVVSRAAEAGVSGFGQQLQHVGTV